MMRHDTEAITMKKTADFLIDRRYIISAIMLALAVACGILAAVVPVNKDRTKYLSDDSNMKHGLSIINSDFPEAEEKSSIRVMFDDLNSDDISEIQSRLEAIPYVSSINYEPDNEDYNKDNHTLFIVNSSFDYKTDEEKSIEESIKNGFSEYRMTFRNNDLQETTVPLGLLLLALGLMSLILFIMCDSWLEPVLFLITIGIAVVINMGTNIVFPYIDEMTLSMGPIIQLVLSMDYSIILMNRYRREKEEHTDKFDAMKAAIAASVSSIASSSLTTAVGLLALVFLSFKLGPELGIVLAKGVIISMVSVLTVLPLMILSLDKWLEKTKKKSVHLPMGFMAAFSRKFRFVMPFVFIALFVGFYFLQGLTGITFIEKSEDPLIDIFPKDNTIVLIYNNTDEEQIPGIVSKLEEDENITEILGYYNTLGKEYTAGEMSEAVKEMGGEAQIDENMVSMLYLYYNLQYNGAMALEAEVKLTIPQMFDYICDELMDDIRFSLYFNDDIKALIEDGRAQLENAAAQLKGTDYSRLVITSDYKEESPETLAFIDNLRELCDNSLEEYYLVGTSAMVSEMSDTFEKEYLMITLITAIAVFLVVLIAFRNPAIPLMLTLLVQCGVFITVFVIGAYSGSIYYLALLIVQSILMGATIDYGIVFSNFYKESRKSLDMADSLKAAYEGSVHTIMTSGSILVLVLFALGFFTESAMIAEVSTTMSIGSLIAILLILFVLPGTIAAFDRFISRKKG